MKASGTGLNPFEFRAGLKLPNFVITHIEAS